MSRTKTASKKKTSPELKTQQDQNVENSAQQNANRKTASNKTDNEKSHDSKNRGDTFGYDSLARQTLDLWRDQLAHFLNNPDALKDMNKVMEPAAKMMSSQMSPQITQMFTPLFSGGMDLWLMMLEQLGKAANMNTKGAFHKDADKSDEQKTASNGKTEQTRYGQGGTENRSAAASALSGAGAYAVAQLAGRLADLEKRFDEFAKSSKPEGFGKPDIKSPAKKTARKKKTTPSVVAAAKRAKQQAGR